MVKQSLNHIEALKNGVLIVRLKDISNRKQQLLKLGMQKKAEEEAARTVAVNQYIRRGFAEYFDFCPVVFVFEGQGKVLQLGQTDTLKFFDYEMNPAPSPTSTFPSYYIADFEKAYGEQIIHEGADGKKRMAAGVAGYPALVIKDPDFIPLSKPFPHEVVLAYQNKDVSQAVRELNRALKAFEIKAQKKKIKSELRNRRKNL